jgi:hypothetical protein
MMIYLGTYEFDDEWIVHEFICNNKFYCVHQNYFNNEGCERYEVLVNLSEYHHTEPFVYKLPVKLRYIEYHGFRERMNILRDIVDEKIFDSI